MIRRPAVHDIRRHIAAMCARRAEIRRRRASRQVDAHAVTRRMTKN